MMIKNRLIKGVEKEEHFCPYCRDVDSEPLEFVRLSSEDEYEVTFYCHACGNQAHYSHTNDCWCSA